MDRHATEDELIARLSSDLDAGEAAWLDAHLARCAECRSDAEAWADMLRLTAHAPVPEPDADFEARMWTRVSGAIADGSTRSHWTVRSRAWLGAWAAIVMAVAGAGVVWGRGYTGPTPSLASTHAVVDPRGARERVLLSALTDHFADTEVLLVELMNAPDTPSPELTFERATADELVASGRLYRETARQTGDPQLADVLDDLESVLVEVARSPDTVTPRDIDAWRAHIQDDGLLFKVRAVNETVQTRLIK
ncbi:MAG TPA: zf-HC2 domain-containing protein [Vicinamibacterales bacterium]|nr:zf-HC2 domain-containing protein [Vicinamibacterales bacterium]